jgi:hypothetical protein
VASLTKSLQIVEIKEGFEIAVVLANIFASWSTAALSDNWLGVFRDRKGHFVANMNTEVTAADLRQTGQVRATG